MVVVAALPSGTVTFLFTDIEGSTRLLQRLGEDWGHVLEHHHLILRQAIEGAHGFVLSIEGDGFFAVFTHTIDAVAAASAVQRSLHTQRWPEGVSIRVRMGIHAGRGVRGGDGYVGLDVHRAARISAAAHGGQVLLSSAARALVEHDLPVGVGIRDLGPHRMKDIELPERLHQLVIDGLPPADFPRFADGVFWVDLSEISDAGLVPSAIAAALRVGEVGEQSAVDSLIGHLEGRELLLLLDNFEQVVEAAAPIGALLEAVPGLRVLVTSRLPLHLGGEQEYPVPVLALPDPSGPAEPHSVMEYESVALFVERAKEVRPGFALTPQSARAVVETCTRLDGLPLAIEIAASRVKVLSPEALLARLGQRLPLLSGGNIGRPERQRTLRSAIEWSHDLLGGAERQLFARLAVFAGGWTLESAESVCGHPFAGDPAAASVDVLDVLGSLVDASLVRPGDAPGGDARFGMLETIQEFALGWVSLAPCGDSGSAGVTSPRAGRPSNISSGCPQYSVATICASAR
jgi:predicted ATPase/class 3 adenylate cyclase